MNVTYITILVFFLLTVVIITVFRDKLLTAFRISASFLPTNTIRILFLRLGGVKVGKKVKIGFGSSFGKDIVIKDRVVIASRVILGRGTKLGKGVLIESYCKLYMASILDNTIVHSGSSIFGSEKNIVRIGENCTVGYHSILDGSFGLKIGNFVHLASPSVGIWTHSSINNALNSVMFSDAAYQSNLFKKKVSIGSNIWIGGNVTIYPGISIGESSIVLPNSVVNSDVIPGTTVGGIPARKIKRRINY